MVKSETIVGVYDGLLELARQEQDSMHFTKLSFERYWVARDRPYYNVWPKIVDPLSRIDIDAVAPADAQFPIDAVLVRFGKGAGSLERNGRELQSALVVIAGAKENSRVAWDDSIPIPSERELDNGPESRPMVSILANWGGPVCILQYWLEAATIGDGFRQVENACGAEWCPEEGLRLMKFLAAIGIIAKNPSSDLIQPDVLDKDRIKWDETHEQAIVDRAVRRGKLGWDIGREIHCSPHWRRPHAALYHVGKGRKDTRIVFRKGAVVKRDDITKIPTGYLADEEST